MKANLIKTSLDGVKALRKKYLNDPSWSQELFLELKVSDLAIGPIQVDGREAGYYCIGSENDMTEFYLKSEYRMKGVGTAIEAILFIKVPLSLIVPLPFHGIP